MKYLFGRVLSWHGRHTDVNKIQGFHRAARFQGLRALGKGQSSGFPELGDFSGRGSKAAVLENAEGGRVLKFSVKSRFKAEK